MNNRKEWEQKGETVVQELIEKVRANKKYKDLVEQRGLTARGTGTSC
jgi:hypothetical protein